jgi:hypothetical protein
MADIDRVSLLFVLTRLIIRQSGGRSTKSVVSDVEAPYHQVLSRIPGSLILTAFIRVHVTQHKQFSTSKPSPKTIFGSSDASTSESLILPTTISFQSQDHFPSLIPKQLPQIKLLNQHHHSPTSPRCAFFQSLFLMSVPIPIGLN